MKEATDSDYWRAVFSNGFKETESVLLELPEEDADSFEVIIKRVYGAASGFIKDDRDFFGEMSISLSIKLYGLAEYFMVKSLAEAVITDLWGYAKEANFYPEHIPAEDFEYFESRTKRGCQMDNLLVDWVLAGISAVGSDHDETDTDDYPDWLMRADFKKAFPHIFQSSRFKLRSVGSYHQRDDTVYGNARRSEEKH